MKLIKAEGTRQYITPNAVVTPLATKHLGAAELSVIRQGMQPGHKTPTHSQSREEVMVLLSGSVTIIVNGEQATMVVGDTLIVPAGIPHSIENSGSIVAEWLIISPAGMQFYGPDNQLMSPEWAQ